MKKLLILAALLSTQAMALSSDDRDVQVGFCGAYHLAKGNNAKASQVADMSRNKTIMQQAAKFYIANFKQDVAKSIKIGELACSNIGA